MPEKKQPVLLFVHGFRGNHLGLKDTVKYFEEKGYRCHVPDIPPAFNTKKENLPKLSSHTADGYAKWIADYILDQRLDRPILIGHSMGSIICAATAEKYPELIHEKILFLSPVCEKPPKFICWLAPFTQFMPSKVVGYLTTKYLIIKKDRTSLKEILKMTYQCAEKFTGKNDVFQAAKFSISYAISDFNFDKKAVFIAGESDKLNSKVQVKKLGKKHNAKPIFLQNSGHLINYECPLELAITIEKNL